VVHNADYSLVTEARPLVRGEHAFLNVTGLGEAVAGGARNIVASAAGISSSPARVWVRP
jgi:hypothetical protein